MALLITDTCENTSQLSGSSSLTVLPARTGNGFDLPGGSARAEYNGFASGLWSSSWTVGFAVKPASGSVFVTFWGDNGALQCWLGMNANGSMDVKRFPANTIIGSSAAGALTLGVWQYVEVQVVMGTTTGTFTVRVNGVSKIALTNVNTTGTSSPTTTVRGLWLGYSVSAVQMVVDDVYVRNDATFQGDPVIPPDVPVLVREPFNDLTNPLIGATSAATIVATNPRNGNNMQQTVSTAFVRWDLGANKSDTVTVGFGFRLGALTASGQLCAFYGDANATPHISITFTTGGALEVRRGLATGTVLATSAGSLVAATTWYYLEVQVKLHDTAGTYEVRLNGAAVIGPTSGADTRNAGTDPTFDTVRLESKLSTAAVNWDDFYLKVGAGATFLGPINVVDNRVARQSVRVGFVNATTTARLGGLQLRTVTAGAGGTARLGAYQLRVLRTPGTPLGYFMNYWDGSVFASGPVKLWDGAAFVDPAAAPKTWTGAAFA